MNSLFFRYALAGILWLGSFLLVVAYIKISIRLWREALIGQYHLTLNRNLPLLACLIAWAAIILAITGLVVLAPDAIGLWDEILIIACVVGVLAGINIFIRQRSVRR